jgi:CheY-like chemotaxis protein
MATRRRKVLVVDDDEDTARTFAYLLISMGHEATFLTDPYAVVEAVNLVKPHIVFLDLGMPGLDGWEVAKRLRLRYPQEHDTLHIVAVSGHGEDEARMKSRKAGFDAHVLKPVDMQLVQVIMEQMDTQY